MKNNRPIAILLAVYNGAMFLHEQIDSLLAQSSDEWTLYIRNDASSDDTQAIIDAYCAAHPSRIFEVDRGGENLGCRNNFFRLLEAVESDYYMFCDADDVWLPEKVALSVAEVRRLEALHAGKPVMVFADAMVCDAELNVTAASLWRSRGMRPEKLCSYDEQAVFCTVGGALSCFNAAARRLVIPVSSNRLMFDHWIAMQVARNGVLSPLCKPLIKYRLHGGNIYGGGELALFARMRRKWSGLCYALRVLHASGYGSYARILYHRVRVEFKRRFR